MPPTVVPSIQIVPQESVPIATFLVDIVNGNMFLNNGNCFLYISNPAGADANIQVMAVPDDALRTGTAAYIPGYQVVVPASSSAYLGPFTQQWWNQTQINIGYVYFNCDRNVTRAVIIQG